MHVAVSLLESGCTDRSWASNESRGFDAIVLIETGVLHYVLYDMQLCFPRIPCILFVFVCIFDSIAEWLACWTQAQKGPGSNRSRDAVG